MNDIIARLNIMEIILSQCVAVLLQRDKNKEELLSDMRQNVMQRINRLPVEARKYATDTAERIFTNASASS